MKYKKEISIISVAIILLVIGGVCFVKNKLFFYQKSEKVIISKDKDGEKLGIVKNIFSKNGQNFLTIDYVEWLTGKEAIKASLEDGECKIENKTTEQAVEGLKNLNVDMGFGEEYGLCAPSGVYIRNKDSELRTFVISSSNQIETYPLNEEGNMIREVKFISIGELKDLFNQSILGKEPWPFYRTIVLKDNTIIKIIEPMLP